MAQTIFIAEIGENHLGDMTIARSLIHEAARAGADYVKFQSYNAACFHPSDPEYDWFKKVSLSDDDHFLLKKTAREEGIAFLSSPFSVERAQFLKERLSEESVKIASGVMLNEKLLTYVNQNFTRVFLSTGMATIPEIEYALSFLKRVPELFLLHCTTQYPCEDHDVNLLALEALRDTFPDIPIGYSDHTIGTVAILGSVSLGARVVEKHFTFDTQATEGTDHLLSLDRDMLRALIADIRRLEKMRGVCAKQPTESERSIINFVRNRFA